MYIKRVTAVYFSATGTTERVVTALADTVADRLGAERMSVCFNLPESRQQSLVFGPQDLVVVGLPVYAGRVPNLLLPYLRDRVTGGGALAVPVVLYGNRDFDDALIELRDLLTANGFAPVAAGAFVGEHAFSTILGAGRPDAEDMALVEQLALAVVEAASAPSAPTQPVAVEGCQPVRPYYTPRDHLGQPIKDFLAAKPVTDADRCTACGLCARLCPMGAIDAANVAEVPGKCFKCCACVKRCPTGAKRFEHAGYLYHQHELEAQYAGRRAPSRIFL